MEVESDAVSVDTQEDLQFVREKMLDDPFFNEYKDKLRGSLDLTIDWYYILSTQFNIRKFYNENIIRISKS